MLLLHFCIQSFEILLACSRKLLLSHGVARSMATRLVSATEKMKRNCRELKASYSAIICKLFFYTLFPVVCGSEFRLANARCIPLQCKNYMSTRSLDKQRNREKCTRNFIQHNLVQIDRHPFELDTFSRLKMWNTVKVWSRSIPKFPTTNATNVRPSYKSMKTDSESS